MTTERPQQQQGNQAMQVRSPLAGEVIHDMAGGAMEVAKSASMAAEVMSAKAVAEVQGRMTLARRFPRDIMVCRQKVLASCSRFRFAEKARYAKPQGKVQNPETKRWEQNYVRGFSIRFAEELVRDLGNIYTETQIVHDDDHQRVLQVFAMDLETNATFSLVGSVSKTVERKKLGAGQKALGTRENTYGDTVFIVQATDDEVNTKASAATAKLRRNCILALCPADLLEEAEEKCALTMSKGSGEDPMAAAKKMVDAFAGLNVTAEDLKLYLGHDVAKCSPAQRTDLLQIWTAIKEGNTTWQEVIEESTIGPSEQKVADRKTEKAEKKAAATPQLAELALKTIAAIREAPDKEALSKILKEIPKELARDPDVETALLDRQRELK